MKIVKNTVIPPVLVALDLCTDLKLIASNFPSLVNIFFSKRQIKKLIETINTINILSI